MSNDFHFRLTSGLLFGSVLTNGLFAEEDDARVEHKTHRMQFNAFSTVFSQEFHRIGPLHASVLKERSMEAKQRSMTHMNESSGREVNDRRSVHSTVISGQMLENGAVLLVNALHFVYVFGN